MAEGAFVHKQKVMKSFIKIALFILIKIKMTQIFQSFVLDLERMAELSEAALPGLNLSQAGRTLREELVKKGYVVLESVDSFGGAALGVMVGRDLRVGGDFRMGHKQDFYELTGRLGLMYRPGACYVNAEERPIAIVSQIGAGDLQYKASSPPCIGGGGTILVAERAILGLDGGYQLPVPYVGPHSGPGSITDMY